jgi:outer membrane immunogenic protein
MRCLWVAVLSAIAPLALGGVASGADLPDAPPPQPPIAPVMLPAYNWSGFYLGIAGGLAYGRSQQINTDPSSPTLGLALTNPYNVSGGLVGGELGYNWQFGNWLIGAEADMSWVDQSGTTSDIPPFNTAVTQTSKVEWLQTDRVRLGGLVTDRWLVYATGGFATGGMEAVRPANTVTYTQTQTEFGWTAGAGAEFAVIPHLSVKFEYLFVDLEKQKFFMPNILAPGGGVLLEGRSIGITDNIVRAGVNYKFQ